MEAQGWDESGGQAREVGVRTRLEMGGKHRKRVSPTFQFSPDCSTASSGLLLAKT